jgi:hypothetical protein
MGLSRSEESSQGRRSRQRRECLDERRRSGTRLTADHEDGTPECDQGELFTTSGSFVVEATWAIWIKNCYPSRLGTILTGTGEREWALTIHRQYFLLALRLSISHVRIIKTHLHNTLCPSDVKPPLQKPALPLRTSSGCQSQDQLRSSVNPGHAAFVWHRLGTMSARLMIEDVYPCALSRHPVGALSPPPSSKITAVRSIGWY